MEAKAITRFVRLSPRKARLVADLVRGKSALEALDILEFTNKKAAKYIEKTLRSAIANAENNNNMDVSKLYIAECYAGSAPTMKRIKPRAQGRAYRILKRNSHITIVLDER